MSFFWGWEGQTCVGQGNLFVWYLHNKLNYKARDWNECVCGTGSFLAGELATSIAKLNRSTIMSKSLDIVNREGWELPHEKWLCGNVPVHWAQSFTFFLNPRWDSRNLLWKLSHGRDPGASQKVCWVHWDAAGLREHVLFQKHHVSGSKTEMFLKFLPCRRYKKCGWNWILKTQVASSNHKMNKKKKKSDHVFSSVLGVFVTPLLRCALEFQVVKSCV